MWCSHCFPGLGRNSATKYRGNYQRKFAKFGALGTLRAFHAGDDCKQRNYITMFRCQAYQNPEGSTWGISNATIVLVAKYAITLNIKNCGFNLDAPFHMAQQARELAHRSRSQSRNGGEAVRCEVCGFLLSLCIYDLCPAQHGRRLRRRDQWEAGTHHMSEIAMVQFSEPVFCWCLELSPIIFIFKNYFIKLQIHDTCCNTYVYPTWNSGHQTLSCLLVPVSFAGQGSQECF